MVRENIRQPQLLRRRPAPWWRPIRVAIAGVGVLAVGLVGLVVPMAPAAHAAPSSSNPLATAVATLVSTGTGHGTPAQSFVNTANGFGIGDDDPYNGVVSSGDTVRYEVRLAFEPGPARVVDVRLDLPPYLIWSPTGDPFCVNGHFVTAQRVGDICRFTVPRGITETRTSPLLLTAADTHGRVVTGQQLVVGTALAAQPSYFEFLASPVTVVSAPMVDVVLTAPPQFQLNAAQTGFANVGAARNWSASGISGHLLAVPMALRPAGFHPTHGVSTGGAWSGQLDVSGFPECTTWRVNGVETPVVDGLISFGPVSGNVRFDYTMGAGCLPYLAVGEQVGFQARVIVNPTSFAADDVMLNNGTGWQPGDGTGPNDSTFDSARGAIAGRPLVNNDFTVVQVRRPVPPRPPVGVDPGDWRLDVSKAVLGPWSAHHTIFEDENLFTGYSAEGLRHQTEARPGHVAPGTELVSRLQASLWGAVPVGSQLILVDTWNANLKQFDPTRTITVTAPFVTDDGEEEEGSPVQGYTIWWTDQPRTTAQASNLADPGGWRQGVPDETAQAIRVVFAPDAIEVPATGAAWINVQIPFVVSDHFELPDCGTVIRNTMRGTMLNAPGAPARPAEEFQQVILRMPAVSTASLWHVPTHVRQFSQPGSAPQAVTQDWLDANLLPLDFEVTYRVTPIVHDLQRTSDRVSPVVTVELDRCLNTPINTSAQWNMVVTPAIPGPTGRVCGDPASTPVILTFTPNTTDGTVAVARWVNADGNPVSAPIAWGGELPPITYTARPSVWAHDQQFVHTNAQLTVDVPGTPESILTNWEPTRVMFGTISVDAAGIASRFSPVEFTRDLIWDVDIAATVNPTDTVIVFPRAGVRGSDCELLPQVDNYEWFDGPPCSDFHGIFDAVSVVIDVENSSDMTLWFTTTPGVTFDPASATWYPVPASGMLPANATGLRVQLDPDVHAADNVDGWAVARLAITLTPDGNHTGDVYQMWLGAVRPGDLVPWPDHIDIVASTIAGRVWLDENNNGRHLGEGEPGIEGVLVTLHRVIDGEIDQAVYRHTRTCADGYYLFEYLFSGQYVVIVHREDVIPMNIETRFGKELDVDVTYSFRGQRFAAAREQSGLINLGLGALVDRVDFGFHVPDPFLMLDKTEATTTCSGGVCTVMWDVILTNIGNTDLNDVRFYDRLPADAFDIRAYGVDREPNLCQTDVGLQQCVPAVYISAGATSLALDVDGNVWAWGNGAAGQIGIGDTEHRFSPVRLTMSDAMEPLPRFTYIAFGGGAAIALDVDGNVWAWGNGATGRLGLGDTENRLRPVQLTTSNDGQELPRFTSVVPGPHHMLALDEVGNIWAWGGGAEGRLGLGDTANRLRPVQLTTSVTGQDLPQFVSVAAGFHHSAAVDEDGYAWAWGRSLSGQTGVGDTVRRLRPIQITMSAAMEPLPRFVSVSAGSDHTLALDEAGNVWAWGFGTGGHLGVGDHTSRFRPVQLMTSVTGQDLPQFVSISAGFAHSAALDVDGNVWAWGRGDSGQLGVGDTLSRTRPIQVTQSLAGQPVLPRFVSISAGNDNTLAVGEDGTVWAWGGSNNGQLGVGDTLSRNRPIQTHVFGPRWNVVYGARLPVLETVRTDEHVTNVFAQHVPAGSERVVRLYASFLQPYEPRVIVNQAWVTHPLTPVVGRGPTGHEWPPASVTPEVGDFDPRGVPGNWVCDTNAPGLIRYLPAEGGEPQYVHHDDPQADPAIMEDLCDQVPALLPGTRILPGSLSGVVWYDANGDGLRDPDPLVEPLLEGVRAILMRGDQVMGQQYTGPDGSFLFTGLPPGNDFWVRFVVTHLDAGEGQSFAFTYQRPSGLDEAERELNSSAARPGGYSHRYVVVSEQETRWVNAGVIRVNTALEVTKNLTYWVPAITEAGEDVYALINAAGDYVLDGDGNRTYVRVIDGVPVFVMVHGDTPAPAFDVTVTVTNTGNEALTGLAWEDVTLSGPSMTNIACTFEGEFLTATVVEDTTRYAWTDLVLPPGAYVTCTGVVTGLMPGSTHNNVFDVVGEGVISGHPVAGEDDLTVQARAYAIGALMVATGVQEIGFTWNIDKTATHYCTAGAVQCQDPVYAGDSDVWRSVTAATMPVETLVGTDVWFRYELAVDAAETRGEGTATVAVTLTNDSPWPRTLTLTGDDADVTVLVGGVPAIPTLVGGQPLVGSTVVVPAVSNGTAGQVTVTFEIAKTASQFASMPIMVSVDADDSGDLWRLDALSTLLHHGNVLLTGDGSEISVVIDTFNEFANTFNLGERTLNATDPTVSAQWNAADGVWVFTYIAARGSDLTVPGSEPPVTVANDTVLHYPNTATVTWNKPNPEFDSELPVGPDNPATIPATGQDDETVSVVVRDYALDSGDLTVAGVQGYGFAWGINKTVTHYCIAGAVQCQNPAYTNDSTVWRPIVEGSMPVETLIGEDVWFRYELAVDATRAYEAGIVTVTVPFENPSPVARTLNLSVPDGDLELFVGGVRATPVGLVGSTVIVPAATSEGPGMVTVTFTVTKTAAQLATLPVDVTVVVSDDETRDLWWLALIGAATGQLTNENLIRTIDGSQTSVVTDTFPEFANTFQLSERALDATNTAGSAQWSVERQQWVFTYQAARGGDLVILGSDPVAPVVNGTVLSYLNTATVTWNTPNPEFDPELPAGPDNPPTISVTSRDDETVGVVVRDYALSGDMTVTGVQGYGFTWGIDKTATHYCTAGALCATDESLWNAIGATSLPVETVSGTDVWFRYELAVGSTRVDEAGTVTVTVPLENTSPQARTITLTGVGADLEVFVGGVRAAPTVLAGSTVIVPAATSEGPGAVTATFTVTKTAAQLATLPVDVTAVADTNLWWLAPIGAATGQLTEANLTRTSDGSHTAVVTDTFVEFVAAFTVDECTLNASAPTASAQWDATRNLWVFVYDAARGGGVSVGVVYEFPNIASVTWVKPNPYYDPDPEIPWGPEHPDWEYGMAYNPANPPRVLVYQVDDDSVFVVRNLDIEPTPTPTPTPTLTPTPTPTPTPPGQGNVGAQPPLPVTGGDITVLAVAAILTVAGALLLATRNKRPQPGRHRA